MADEEKKATEEETPKKKSKMKLLIIVGVTLALAGGGYFGYRKYKAKGKSKNVASANNGSDAAQAQGLGPVYAVDTFIVNLAGNSGDRYLKVNMRLELNGEEVGKELNSRMPQVRDVLLTLLSSMSFEDVRTTSGKFSLKEEIISQVNGVLTSGQVRQVFFTEFVVQ